MDMQRLLSRLRPKPTVAQLSITPILPFQWRQGEHLALTGRTGSGKTTLANVLLHARGYTLALRSKADDAPLPGARIRRASDFSSRPDVDRWLLDPPYERQLVEFWNALETVWREGHWTVYCDELWYLTQLKQGTHRLGDRIDRLLTQGRSKKITVVCGAQRPVQISRFALSQATHIVCFYGDNRDARTLAEVTDDAFGAVIQDLGKYEFAWYHVPTRKIWRGRVQDLLPVGDTK